MVKKSTVLVLGAGASHPYRFPLGRKLMADICQNVHSSYASEINPTNDPSIRALIADFRDALRTSGQRSVDAFLEHRTEFKEIGKKAIARALIPWEDEEALFDLFGDTIWYDYLLSKMAAPSVDAFAANRIIFVTFNYDRSLEHFLHKYIRSNYRLSVEEAEKVRKQIKIIHVHGELCPYDPTGNDGRQYKPDASEATVRKAANCIRVIGEEELTTELFVQAYDHLCHAERIAFIGFGYHAKSVARLRPGEWNVAGKLRPFGTTVGLKSLEIAAIETLFSGRISLAKPDCDALSFLRESFTLE